MQRGQHLPSFSYCCVSSFSRAQSAAEPCATAQAQSAALPAADCAAGAGAQSTEPPVGQHSCQQHVKGMVTLLGMHCTRGSTKLRRLGSINPSWLSTGPR